MEIRDKATMDGGRAPLSLGGLRGLLTTQLAGQEKHAAKAGLARQLFDGHLDKESARTSLVREQSGRCAFCECGIGRLNRVRIAPWTPLSTDPTLAFDWNNLFLSCGETNVETCDRWQRDQDPSLPAPLPAVDHAQYLELDAQGRFTVAARCPYKAALERAINVVFNLNADHLCQARLAAVELLYQRVEETAPNREARRARLQAMLSALPGEGKPFPTAQSVWLRKRIARAG
jgi:uncharacterized protein (TIGR02646 family)